MLLQAPVFLKWDPAPIPQKTETLRQKQSRFTHTVAGLLLYARHQGFEVSLGDAYRDPRAFGAMGIIKRSLGIGYSQAKSAHKHRLAIDLNLFKNGVFLAATEDHTPLGVWWEQQGGVWGGRFKDGNHYSFEHEGIK